MWDIELEPLRDWLNALDNRSKEQVAAALELLRQYGPDLKRPVVGKIVTSRHANMKELRSGSAGRSEIRILFIFDPDKKAIMLVAGDKQRRWNKWYAKASPLADAVYDEWIAQRDRRA